MPWRSNVNRSKSIRHVHIFDKEAFGGGCIYFVSAIGHWLPAAGLIQRIIHVQAESFQEFQGGYTDLRINEVDVAGYKQPDPHVTERRNGCGDEQSLTGLSSVLFLHSGRDAIKVFGWVFRSKNAPV